jgi:hypothetical protein
MIDRENHPVSWYAMLDELADAREHLGKLIEDLRNAAHYTETEFRIDLGHVYAHLNRAWYQRRVDHDFSADEWMAASQFPDDLAPVG